MKSLKLIILNKKINIYHFYLQSTTLSLSCSAAANSICKLLGKACLHTTMLWAQQQQRHPNICAVLLRDSTLIHAT